MSLRDRLHQLENDRPDPPVVVWRACTDDPAFVENATGERR